MTVGDLKQILARTDLPDEAPVLLVGFEGWDEWDAAPPTISITECATPNPDGIRYSTRLPDGTVRALMIW